ncbi:hypothetical protein LJC45_00445 [Alistipes sp. OttesenSCG-928-B03]|nr:hypothetical protein [Alistipes sp. OttesenSCG-928-B03]
MANDRIADCFILRIVFYCDGGSVGIAGKDSKLINNAANRPADNRLASEKNRTPTPVCWATARFSTCARAKPAENR